MSNSILEITKMPAKKDNIEDMSEAVDKAKSSSIIEIKSDIPLQEHAQGLVEQIKNFFQLDSLIQLFVGIILIAIAYIITTIGKKYIKKLLKGEEEDEQTFSKTTEVWLSRLVRVLFPAIMTILLLFSYQTAKWLNLPSDLLKILTNLSVAAFVVRFVSTFVHSKVVAKWVAGIVWTIAALHIVGWWDMISELLDSIRFGMGENKLSLLMIIKGAFYFIVFLWVAKILANSAEKKIKNIDELTPSLRVLFSKLLKIALIVTAFMFGLNAIGVDLTSFAIFGGAIGVGLGFGLQKVVSNFISGIILLLDRSIKPGDVIAVGSSFGWVNTLGARYVSIIQRDGKEHLIPNELLITEKVENWSFSNNDVRLHIDIGVSYNSDIPKALELCLEAALEEPRVNQFPKPVVRVTGFGDSSVNMQIRGWINDPVNGVGNIKSDILLKVWDKFRDNGIEIPYPQRDLHIKSLDSNIIEKIKNDVKAELSKELKS